jgi:subtilase family serine protease
MTMRPFFALVAVTTAALACALPAAAAPVRPGTAGIPFVAVGDQVAHAAPVCPNGLVCYTPALLEQAYDFPGGRSAPTGAGQTIVLVEAFGSPTLAQDLAQFDAENALPAPPSVTVVTQRTPVSSVAWEDRLSWTIETSLDVEYAHAFAPGAALVVAVADTDDTPNVAEVEREVLPSYPGAIVSQSFGEDETGAQSDDAFTASLQQLFLAQAQRGGTVVASSGDLGATNGGATPMAAFPASSPLVLAAGATEGAPFLWRHGSGYGAEQVWNDAAGASGGAPSAVFPAPSWQAGVTGLTERAEPDVSFNGAIDGGVVVVVTTPLGRHTVVGGTSAAAPAWAAIVALANELRGRQARPPLGVAAASLYALARDRRAYAQDFHDITAGTNAFGGAGFAAGTGYDLASGLGTPDVARLLHDLES